MLPVTERGKRDVQTLPTPFTTPYVFNEKLEVILAVL